MLHRALYLCFLFFQVNAIQTQSSTGTVLFFGNNLQHSLLVGHRLTENFKYFPKIIKIHSDKPNEDRYIISIHRVPRLYLPITKDYI